MNTGGAETFLMKIYRHLNLAEYQMDFCVNSKENYYAKEIENMGGKLYITPTKSSHPIKAFNSIKNIVATNKYDYVIRVNEHSLSTLDLLAAKLGGATHLIMRSSNASSGSKPKLILHKLFSWLPKSIPTVKLAPSRLAAEYTFGKGCMRRNNVYLLRNGLDLKIFSFSNEKRLKIRNELGLSQKFVIGHIGRFAEQKNHDFLIEIFKDYIIKNQDSVLVLVGEGELQDTIKQKVIEEGLDGRVLFLGVRTDVNDILNIFDCFVFPSLYEGMPNAVIEAQTNGVPCIISDIITYEANVNNFVEFESLKEPASKWAERVDNIFCNHFIGISNNEYIKRREEAAMVMKDEGYDISDCVNQFVNKVFAFGDE
jgi:glycosyltransferase involved in cell wall biosynthesis